MRNAFSVYGTPLVAIVGDAKPSLSTPLYEAALAERGIAFDNFDVIEVMRTITDNNGTTLLDNTIEDPYCVHASSTFWTLDADSPLRRASAVIIETDDYTEYVALLNAVFDGAGLAQANSPSSTAIARDKWLTHLCMEGAGLPVARTRLVYDREEALAVAVEAGYPLVVKVLSSSFGDGVRLANNTEELLVAIDMLDIDRQPLLIQDYIECSASDRRIVLVNGSPMAMMQRRAKAGEFRANLSQGGSAEAVVPSVKERRLAIKATQALGLGFVGLDLARVTQELPGREYLKLGDVFVIEANSCAGLSGLRDATGVNAAPAVVALLMRRIMDKRAITEQSI